MEIKYFENLIQNPKLKEKLETIVKTTNIENKYRMSQMLLEYINATYLTKKLEIKMEDYSILRIMNEYSKIDENLFEQMTAINAIYEEADEKGVIEEDIEYILLKTDYIYGYLKNKYGEGMN